MRPQPYSLQSFIELAESENRRGRNISDIDTGVRLATKRLRLRRDKFRNEIARCVPGDPTRERIREKYRNDRARLRKAREIAVEAALHRAINAFEAKTSKNDFSFLLKSSVIVGKKQTYQISSALDVSYPAKQAAEVLKRATSVALPGRNSLVRALKTALKREYPHAIYKMDILAFFESIPHSNLLEQVQKYPMVDTVTIGLIKSLLEEYRGITSKDVGLPRGVGLSSQLSELYLTGFDSIVKSVPGVLFYARYVDDVVVVIENGKILSDVKSAVSGQLIELQLELNPSKTCEILADECGDYLSPSAKLEYLGYRFHRSGGELHVGLTDRRKARRIERLKVAVQAWLATAPSALHPNHGVNGLFLDRLSFLASNTKLLNSKNNVVIGLYASNSALDPSADELLELNQELEKLLRRHGSKMPPKLKSRVEQIDFVETFKERKFLRFSQQRIEQIVNIWKGLS